ncbi:KH domain-containing protein [Staphylospora marina]|uniref:KH domain-containing protein n=1 Tax=Staphylospora marina TaxID=2490858 RepID=UPI000F5C232C|nr:KH domain-containing protein [Staphylospora marina]
MKDLVEYIVRSLVEDPERVSVRERVQGDTVIFEVTVAPGDKGKVIGKNGRFIKAIRTVVGAAAWKENRQVRLEMT